MVRVVDRRGSRPGSAQQQPTPARAGALAAAMRHAGRPDQRARWLAELGTLVAFPTVSGAPRHRADLAAAARWLAEHLRRIGLTRAEVLPGVAGGQPSVYASWEGVPGGPTLLLYGHFDVQAPGDPAAWRTPPFRATLRDDRLYGRGVSDDKGQFFAHLKALESWLATSGRLPVNVKVWLEGEEELGSPTLGAFLDRYGALLRADAALISDTIMPDIRHPAIVVGLRGLARLRLEVRAPGAERHAGRYGGAVPNPLQALCRLVAGLHDEAGRIAVPGLYRDVRAVVATGRPARGATHGQGEPGYTIFERATIRPALNVTAIDGGGPGAIPARAAALLDLRLVPEQDPAAIVALLHRHLTRVSSPELAVRLRTLGLVLPVRIAPDTPAITAAARAVERVWGEPPRLTRSGGTIPVVAALQGRLGIPPVVLGFGLPGDRAHGPDESLALGQFFRGVATGIAFLAEFAVVDQGRWLRRVSTVGGPATGTR